MRCISRHILYVIKKVYMSQFYLKCALADTKRLQQYVKSYGFNPAMYIYK